MGKNNRYILIILLISIFVVSGPIVLLFASGYRYNWHKQRIEKTGIIYIDAEPTDAEIYLNGKKIKKSIPASISRLLPEDYVMEIKSSGYLSWTKTLAVKSGQTTFAKTIILIKDILPRLIWPIETNKSIFNAKATTMAYLITNESWSELYFYDLSTGRAQLLARFAPERYSDLILDLAPDGSRILFTAIDGTTKNRVVMIYQTKPDGLAIEVKELAQMTDIHWSWSSDGANLALLGQNRLIFVDRNQTTHQQKLNLITVRDIIFSSKNLWLLAETNNQLTLRKALLNGQQISEDLMSLPDRNYRFVISNDRWLGLTDHKFKKGLLIDLENYSWLHVPEINDARWEKSENDKRLLLWNEFEIYTFDPAKNNNLALITRISTPITDVVWHPAGTYVLFVTSTGVTASELDGRDRRNIIRLVEFGMINSVAMDEENETLYFIGSVGNQGGLYERPL
jgi:hypothetical protein